MKITFAAVTAALAVGLAAVNAQAALVDGEILNIGAGSKFGMQLTPTVIAYTPLVGINGIVLGTTQATGNSHFGAPIGTEAIGTSIDQPWEFFGNTGLDYTASPTHVLSTSGNTATLDFSGWRWTWNSLPSINLGGGTQVYTDYVGVIRTRSNGTGVATVICNLDCRVGDTYVLDYAAIVPHGDPSGLGDVPYTLHLTGTIGTVPVPAAIWLFGPGLVGLLGSARRRKAM